MWMDSDEKANQRKKKYKRETADLFLDELPSKPRKERKKCHRVTTNANENKNGTSKQVNKKMRGNPNNRTIAVSNIDVGIIRSALPSKFIIIGEREERKKGIGTG